MEPRFASARSCCGVTGSRVTAPGVLQRVVDRRGDDGADRIGAAFAGAFEPERVERRGRVLGDQRLDGRHLARGRHQIIGKRDRERLAAAVVEKFLQQRAADALRDAAGDLALDQHRIDRLADVVGDEITLDRDGAGLAVDAHHRDMNAVRIGHVGLLDPAFGRKAGQIVAE